MLHDILMEEKIFLSWNDKEIISGWLDLHTLLQNVCISIRNETREHDAFNIKFEAEYGPIL